MKKSRDKKKNILYKKILYIILILLVLIITLVSLKLKGEEGGECSISNKSCISKNQIANPASVYCIENGEKLEIRQDATGGQYGVCIFSDDSECEEWKFYRGECNPGENFKNE